MRFYFSLTFFLFLIGCATKTEIDSRPTATMTPSATITESPTVVATLTSTLVPATSTPAPTKTIRPTFTVIPTNTPPPTPKPTKTARPTATPLPITPTKTGAATESTTIASVETIVATPTLIPTRTPVPTALPVTESPNKETAQPDSTTDNNNSADQPVVNVGPTISSIGSLGNFADGTKVVVNGNVTFSQSFSKGFKLTISDGSGQVILLLWHNVYDQIGQRGGLNVGSAVKVTGEVGRFDGQLQVEPRNGSDVVVTQTAGAWGSAKQISALSSIIGQRAMIEGTIQRANVYDNGTKIVLNDGTGEVELFIWANIYQRMPNRDAVLAVGGKLRAVGMISEYRGAIQLQPALPYDVVVLQ